MVANVAAPSGFQTLRRLDGAAPNYMMKEDIIAWNYGSRINFGDPVFRNSSGQIALYVAGGTTVHGIFRGCRYLDPGTLKTEFYPAWRTPTLTSTTTVFALVDTDPFSTFMAQAIGAAFTQANIGQNIDITVSSSGTTTSLAGLSTCSLAGTTANTATLPFRVQSIIGLTGGLVTPAVNAAYVATYDNQWVEVSMNTPDFSTRTGQA
jgi:hypothetical protein